MARHAGGQGWRVRDLTTEAPPFNPVSAALECLALLPEAQRPLIVAVHEQPGILTIAFAMPQPSAAQAQE